MPKFKPVSDEFRQGKTAVQQVKSGDEARVRVFLANGHTFTLDGDELFNLTELLDDVCDRVEDDTLPWPM